jgi:BirA family biotin operon repressor/biotin-[acetyl-CoA-carboxylase] ligase
MKKKSSNGMHTDHNEHMAPVADLHPASIVRMCEGTRIGHTVVCCESVGSTNDEAARMAAAGAREGTVVIAARQTAGRGRKGRAWFSSPDGSLVFSMILRPSRSGETLTALLALATLEVLDDHCGGVSLKWPNDIWIGGRKIAGILAEARGESMVLGMGIDVNEERDSFPAGLRGTAVSVRMIAGETFDRGELLAAVLRSFERAYLVWEREGFGPMSFEMGRRMLWTGRQVLLETEGGTVEGVLSGLTSDGYLRLEVDGKESVYSSGDLSLAETGEGGTLKEKDGG